MPKSKNTPTLIELIQREQEQARRPKARSWFARRRWRQGTVAETPKVDLLAPPAPPEPVAEASPPPPDAPAEPEPLPVEPAIAEPDPPAAEAVVPPPLADRDAEPPIAETEPAPDRSWRDTPPPIFLFEEGRVHLSLNPVTLTWIVGGFFLVVFTAYLVGTGFGRPPAATALTANPAPNPGPTSAPTQTASPLDAAAQRPANPSVLSNVHGKIKPNTPLAVDPRAPAEPAPSAVAPPPPSLESGLNYLWIAHFERHEEADARKALAFLAEHGIPTRLVLSSQGFKLLDASRGYARGEIGALENVIKARKKELEHLGRIYTSPEVGGRQRFDNAILMLYKE